MRSLKEVINEAMGGATQRTIVFEWDDRVIANDENISKGAIKEYRDIELKDAFIKMVQAMLRAEGVPYNISDDKHNTSCTFDFSMPDDSWEYFTEDLYDEVEGWLQRKNKKHKMDAYINKKANFEGIQILCPTNIRGEEYYLNIQL